MISKRNLGPILAIVGGAVVLGAVVTGFIVAGGPGDARAQRLDDLTMRKLISIADRAQCAFASTGKTYDLIEDADIAVERRSRTDNNFQMPCGRIIEDRTSRDIRQRADLVAPGEVSYAVSGPSSIELCGVFRRPHTKDADHFNAFGYMSDAFPEFDQPRPAGLHCYKLDLMAAPRHSDADPAPSLPAPESSFDP